MELHISDDQSLLVDTTRRFLHKHASPEVLRSHRDDDSGYGQSFWRDGTTLGWTSLLVRESQGGGSVSGEGVRDLALIAHEFGRAAAPGPLLSTNVAAAALDRFGTSELHRDILASILAGSVVSWCHAEPVPAQSLGTVDTELIDANGTLQLCGVKSPVEQGSQAGHFLASARSRAGLTQVVVPRDAPGLTVVPLKSVDLTRRFAEVSFDRTPIPYAAVLGAAGEAAPALEWQLQLAVVIQVNEMVGAMERAFEMTLDYAFDRYSFGRPLASYQEIKHRFADMKSWLEASHALANAATRAVGAGDADAGELISAAKSYIAQHGTELCQDCVQLHGGIGLTYEHDLHLYLRRVTLGAATHGTVRDHRLRLADILEAQGT